MADMKIAVKYCGGCNPRFDRTAFVKALEAAALEAGFGQIEFTHADNGGARAFLAVSGCQRACACHEAGGRPFNLKVSAKEDYEKTREKIARILQGETHELENDL